MTPMNARKRAFIDGDFAVADDEPFDIVFARDFASQSVELLEVSEDMLAELLDDDGTIEFKGEGDDIACVCTKTKTYKVTRVETSNEILIVGPPIEGEEKDDEELTSRAGESERSVAVARARATSHLDLTEIAPKLGRLREMLKREAYGAGDAGETRAGDGDDGEGGDGRGFTFEELDKRVQASAGEILRCLEDEHALCLDGRWRGVDPGYRAHALGMLAATAGGLGWPLGAIPERPVAEALASDGFAPEVVMNTLEAFGSPREDDSSVWALDEERTSRFVGERVLRDGVGLKSWRLVDMMKSWRAAMDASALSDFEVKEEYLAGLALIDRPERAMEAFVTTLIASDLPKEPEDRFKALWAVKPRWSMAELEPYLKGQARPGETVESQLLKYTRITQGATPMYSKR